MFLPGILAKNIDDGQQKQPILALSRQYFSYAAT